MDYPQQQLEELKRYCTKLKAVPEGGVTFFYLEELRLPAGCVPNVCDALLCPVPRDGYPSRLFLSVLVSSPYTRNWNVANARIAEKNWVAFSWKVDLPNLTLAQLLVAHLNGFAKEK
jgi:hypothetical protein